MLNILLKLWPKLKPRVIALIAARVKTVLTKYRIDIDNADLIAAIAWALDELEELLRGDPQPELVALAEALQLERVEARA